MPFAGTLIQANSKHDLPQIPYMIRNYLNKVKYKLRLYKSDINSLRSSN